MKSPGYFRLALVGLTLLGLLLQLASLGPWADQQWGFHLYSFLPLPVAIVAWLIVLTASGHLLRRRDPNWLNPLLQRAGSWSQARPAWFAVAAASLSMLCFWFFRSQQDILGDAWPLINDLPKGVGFHPRQPFAQATQQFLYTQLAPLFAEPNTPLAAPRGTAALGSVLCGGLFVVASFFLSRHLLAVSSRGIANQTKSSLLFMAVLLAQGYCVLFFGYLENYTIYVLSLMLYVLAGVLYLRGRLPLILVFLSFALALGCHLSTVILAPSLLVLVLWGLGRQRRKATLRDVTIGLALFLGLDQLFRSMSDNYSLPYAVRLIVNTGKTDGGFGSGMGYIFGARHFRDFFNNQFLTGPWAGLLFLIAFPYAYLKSGYKNATMAFLLSAAFFPLLASWFTSDPVLGYARDWDIFAPVAFLFTVAGLYVVVTYVEETKAQQRTLLFLLTTSFVHLFSWVWLNHDEWRAFERLKKLPLGAGRTEVVAGNWLIRNGRKEEGEKWIHEAIRKYPYNNNAYAVLGTLYWERDEWDKVAEVYTQAVALRPDKPLYRNNLAQSLAMIQKCEEAIPHFRWLVEKQPGNLNHWLGYRTCLESLGRREEMLQLVSRSLPHFEGAARSGPNDYWAQFNYGIVLSDLERNDEAVAAFERALRIEPSSGNALFNIANVRMSEGKGELARSHMARLLEQHPEHPRANLVRSWLRQLAP